MHAAKRTSSPRRAPAASKRPSNTWKQFIAPVVDELGGRAAFCAATGTSVAALSGWLNKGAVPYVRTVVHLAEVLDLDVDAALAAAGKPPIGSLRDRVGEDAETSLPIRVSTWRAERGFDNTTAAQAFGLRPWRFSRLANGTWSPKTLSSIHLVAKGLGISELAVVDAANSDDDVVAEVRAATTGFAGWLRARLARNGTDSFDPAALAQVADWMGLERSTIVRYVTGSAVPDFLSCQLLAGTLGTSLARVFTEAGYDARLARRFARAIPGAAALPRDYQRLPELLRAYRIVRGYTGASLAQAVGVRNHTTIVRWESGENTPAPEMLAQLADVLRIPLSRLLASARLVA